MTSATMVATAAVLAAILAVIMLVGRLARVAGYTVRSSGRLSVVDALPLDAKRRLIMVRCDDRCVLLLTGQQDLLLGWLPEQAE